MIDYIEIYYGEGSFTLGNETGVEFIRVYTKNPLKENGTNIKATLTTKSTNSQEFSYATLLENGWSYLLYFANQNSFFNENKNGKKLKANTNQQYVFVDLSDTNNTINMAYTTLKRTPYKGLSFDSDADGGETVSDNFYIDYNRYFLNDKSIKLSLSTDVQNRKYEESNEEGLAISKIPFYMGSYIKDYEEDVTLIKNSASLSKTFKTDKNNLFVALNIKNLKYKTNNRKINKSVKIGELTDFTQETSYSFALQDDYKLLDNLIVIGNFKTNKYIRNGFMDNSVENLYRFGTIYLPTKNLGFKTFYTISHVPASFYNVDFASTQDSKLDSQKYKYFTFEGAYTFGKSKINLEYFNVHIDDYIYFVNPIYINPIGFMPIGFINVDHTIKTNGFIFDYWYNFDKNSKLEINFFTSQLSETKNNYTQGGFLKYMKDFGKFSYFGSLIYRKGFDYLDLKFDNSYNLNLGATYNFTKNLSLSLKAVNLLDKSTQSLLSDSSTNSSLSLINDYDREVSFSINWRF